MVGKLVRGCEPEEEDLIRIFDVYLVVDRPFNLLERFMRVRQVGCLAARKVVGESTLVPDPRSCLLEGASRRISCWPDRCSGCVFQRCEDFSDCQLRSRAKQPGGTIVCERNSLCIREDDNLRQ